MVIFFISVTPWFFSSANISSLEHWESSLFLITPLEEFRVLSGYVLIFKLWNIFIFSRKFVCFLFSVSIIIVPFLKFLTVLGLFVDIIFCMRNGDNFVNGVSSSNSNMMSFANGGSGCIFSSSELSDYVRLFKFFFLVFAWVVLSISIKKFHEFHWLCSPPITEPHTGMCLWESPFV